MMEVKDQMNNTIRLEHVPSRIISLVPSQTELLFDLGLESEVVGITKFCIHPNEWFQTKTRVGGTKNVDIEKVRALKPDFIIGNKEENTQADIEALREIAPVYMSDIYTLKDALDMIQQVGLCIRKSEKSNSLAEAIQSNFDALKNVRKPFTCLYFMWKDPYFTVGPNTFIDEMISQIGGINLQQTERYPEWDFSSKVAPDVVFLSSEPYPFKEEHKSFFQQKYPHSKIILVDGEYFSWYGSRLINAPYYFKTVLSEVN